MADRSKIEWCDATVTPIRARDPVTGKTGWHCEHATPGCEFCYAEAINKRLGTGLAFTRQNRDKVELYLDENALTKPLRWKRPRTIFWNSMTDGAADFVHPEWIAKIVAVAALTPHHRHIFLTKRAVELRLTFAGAFSLLAARAVRAVRELPRRGGENAQTRFAAQQRVLAGPLPNLFLGVSVEDQRRADERRVPLAHVAAAGWRTFVSYEPALGPVDWSGWEFLTWLISGGESGPRARPSHPDWHRAGRDFCTAHGIAYFFKQWGEWFPGELSDDGDRVCADPDIDHDPAAGGWDFRSARYEAIEGTGMLRVGKKHAGRLLDGRAWSEFPWDAAA